MRQTLLAFVLFAVAGCGASTGVDVQVKNADKISGADALRFEGFVDGIMVQHAVYKPDPLDVRALSATEDLRIVVDEALDGKVLTVNVTPVKRSQTGDPTAVGDTIAGAGTVASHYTKTIVVDLTNK